MGMMKGLYTKIQLGNRLDEHEKAFIKKYQKPKRPKTKKETNQLDFDFDLIHHPSSQTKNPHTTISAVACQSGQMAYSTLFI